MILRRNCALAIGFLLLLARGSFVESAQPPGSRKAQEPAGLDKSKLRPREGALGVGDKVPALTVKDVEGKKEVALAKLQGRPVVLIFGSCT